MRRALGTSADQHRPVGCVAFFPVDTRRDCGFWLPPWVVEALRMCHVGTEEVAVWRSLAQLLASRAMRTLAQEGIDHGK